MFMLLSDTVLAPGPGPWRAPLAAVPAPVCCCVCSIINKQLYAWTCTLHILTHSTVNERGSSSSPSTSRTYCLPHSLCYTTWGEASIRRHMLNAGASPMAEQLVFPHVWEDKVQNSSFINDFWIFPPLCLDSISYCIILAGNMQNLKNQIIISHRIVEPLMASTKN